jgi:hypothetical protein
MDEKLRLNLGCGENKLAGYVNVDKHGRPDLKHDLESFPWPWQTGSVSEIVLSHVLEHLGETTEVYFQILKELYRICRTDAVIRITVPHPRHDDFIIDPTHVRQITPEGLGLLSKKNNREWIRDGFANSPIGLQLDVDFVISGVKMNLEQQWLDRLNAKQLDQAGLQEALRNFNNVVKEIQIEMRVVK